MDDTSSYSISGEYLRTLKSFLNLIYDPIFLKNNMQDEIFQVKKLSVEVLLKNPTILKDVWRQLDLKKKGQIDDKQYVTLKMFEDLFTRPFDSLNCYSYLLTVLCGKNRFPHAQYVSKMIEIQRINLSNDEKKKGTILSQ